MHCLCVFWPVEEFGGVLTDHPLHWHQGEDRHAQAGEGDGDLPAPGQGLQTATHRPPHPRGHPSISSPPHRTFLHLQSVSQLPPQLSCRIEEIKIQDSQLN